MASTPVLKWDDFTGGYHVARAAAGQPDDTWRGTNAYVNPQTGFLAATQAWSALTYTLGSPTADGSSYDVYLFTNGSDVYRIYLTSTANTWNICKYASLGGLGVQATNTSLSTCTAVLAVEPWDSTTLYGSFAPSSGTENFFKFVLGTATLTRYTLSATMRHLARWGQFMVGADATTTRRLRFSNAYDPATWSSGDYVDIGGDEPITALVPFGDTLYVGKADEWYAVTGVLGSTTNVRQVALGYPGPSGYSNIGWNAGSAAATPQGVMFTSTQLECAAAIMNGGAVYVANHGKPGYADISGAWTIRPMTPGQFLMTQRGFGFTSGSTTEAWWLDVTLGSPRWAKLAIPYGSGSGSRQGAVARQMPATTKYQYAYMDVGTTIYRCPLFGSVDSTVSTSTATVHLAEKRADRAFIVRNLYVEVAWTPGVSNPSVAGQVEMRGWPDLAIPGRVASTSATVTPSVTGTGSAPSSALFHDDRYNYATVAIPIDAPAGTSAIPILTFSNCQIRRVWATAEWADTP